MSDKSVLIRKVSIGKKQNRVTLPKSLRAEYVQVKPLKLPNIFKDKKGQAAFEDIFTVIPYLFFAGLLFFIVYFIVGQIKPDVSNALQSSMPSNSPVNVSETMDKTSGGIGLFNSLYPLLLIGLIAMCIVSASFMGSHPVFFFVSLIMLVVMIILGVVFSNVYQTITTDTAFGDTADTFNIPHIFMKYLPVIAFIIVVVVFVIIYSGSSGRSSGGL